MIEYITIESLPESRTGQDAAWFKRRIYNLAESIEADIEDYIETQGAVTIGISGEYDRTAFLSALERLTGRRQQEFVLGKGFDLFTPEVEF
jgi:hypothetical protein